MSPDHVGRERPTEEVSRREVASQGAQHVELLRGLDPWSFALEIRAAAAPGLDVASAGGDPHDWMKLSNRQWEILGRLLNGERAKEIAAAMFISRSTVRNHLASIYRKLGVHSQVELLALVGRANATTPPEI